MTRRKLLAKSAGAAAAAVIGTGPSDVTANVVASPAAPARLEGIWPYCVWWQLRRSEVFPPWSLCASFRNSRGGLGQFNERVACSPKLTIPFPEGGVIVAPGSLVDWQSFDRWRLDGRQCDIGNQIVAVFLVHSWSGPPVPPLTVLDADLESGMLRVL